MATPFDFWPKAFKAPFSGDVTQQIIPRFFSADIQGDPEIEAQVQADVASYGRQLGKILEAVKKIADDPKVMVDVPEIEKLIEDIEMVKAKQRDDAQSRAVSALDHLRKTDEKAWRDLIKKSQKKLRDLI